ncbi:hypothetical protein HAX54_013600, partial [Datura stramonium]|nr:hypothetical protein [Datura stramonium]
ESEARICIKLRQKESPTTSWLQKLPENLEWSMPFQDKCQITSNAQLISSEGNKIGKNHHRLFKDNDYTHQCSFHQFTPATFNATEALKNEERKELKAIETI